MRKLTQSAWVQKATGVAAAQFLRLVWHTSRVAIEPVDVVERVRKDAPIILTFWHGQHLLTPFIRPTDLPAMALISRHRDGEINAIAAERLGVETIRASGTHGSDFASKGGVIGFTALVRALREGYNVAMTADVPKVSRVAGLGIVKIAQVTGRPIYPIAIATQRRIVLDNWDRTTVNLPFGRAAGVAGAPIHVPEDADAGTLELARRAVEEALNGATARAYELTDGIAGDPTRG